MRFVFLTIISGIFLVQSAAAQITPEYISAKISLDTVNPIDGYTKYAEDLARTLSMLTSEQLYRVFQQSVSVPTLNEQLALEPINFADFSSDLNDASKQELDKVLAYLNDNPNVTIQIHGHSSSGGTGNQILSENRARAAEIYLIEQGVDSSRIESSGFGYSEPLDGLDPSDSRNKRIEIIPQ